MKPLSTGAKVGIGILVLFAGCAGFVAWNVLGFLDESNVQATGIQMKKMAEGLVVYASKHENRYPSTLVEAAGVFPDQRVPTDAWGNAFEYEREGSGWSLRSLGKDGERGGRDANADLVYRGDEVETEEEDPHLDWGRVAVVGLLVGAALSAGYGVVGSWRR